MYTLYTTAVAAALAVVVASPGQTVAAQDALASLPGIWRVALTEADGVELNFRMTFAVTKGQDSRPVAWEAYTREGAARELVSARQALFGALAGKMPPRGALVFIGQGTVESEGTAIRLKGALESPFLGNRDFAGVLAAGRIRAELVRSQTRVTAGRIEAIPDTSTEPLGDYSALAAAYIHAVRSEIFDPRLTSRPEYQRFFSELTTRFASARDDLDAIGAFQALIPRLRTSHFQLIRNPQLASRSLAEILGGDRNVDPNGFVRLTFPAPHVAHLRVTRWDRGFAAIDRAFERMDTAGARVLLLDIRGNPGGDHSSLAPLSHLIQQPETQGVIVGRKWHEVHQVPPAVADFARLPELTSEVTGAELFRSLAEHGAVVGRVAPRSPHFAGTVYVFTDGGTASASEPLAHALKVGRRATLIGQPTAGRMLAALPHMLPDGWVATIPVADIIASDGTRLEGRGVPPDVKVPVDRVFIATADRIATVLPYSAAVLRGGSYEGLKQPNDAERAYRDAIRVADRQVPALDAASRAIAHRRLARLLQAKGDQPAALREYEAVLRLIPGDAEALAAVRGR